jgi:hypothetical protein
MEITTLAKIAQSPITYVEINNLIYDMKVELLSGDYNPLDVELQLKAMEETIKQLRSDKDIRQFVLREAEKHGKSFEWRGAKMSIREVGVKYDYSTSGDSEWAILDAQIKKLTEKRTAREKFLQNIPEMGTVSPETGETIYRPAKSSTTSIAVTLNN